MSAGAHPEPDGAGTVVTAAFPTSRLARAAVRRLRGAGYEATISEAAAQPILPPARTEPRADWVRRALLWALGGAGIGAVALAVVVWLLVGDPDGGVYAGAAAGGGAFGAAAGTFYGVSGRLPAESPAGPAGAAADEGPETVEVRYVVAVSTEGEGDRGRVEALLRGDPGELSAGGGASPGRSGRSRP